MALKYLGFAPHRVAATMFGSLVHETIEDVHKTFLRGERVTEEKIDEWFAANYNSLSLSLKTYATTATCGSTVASSERMKL